MKRLTSIFLVLAMLLTLAPMNIVATDAENAVFSDMNETDYYAEAATALEKSDILEGYPDGTFGAEKSITRAEMAAIVCRMIGKEADSESAKGETVFDDVAADHWASGYINIASKEGIINGDGNGKFRPEDDVKYEESIKMVVCASGYGADVVVDPADWSKGYLEVADEKGISANLKGEKGKAATRGDIAVMSYNGISLNGGVSKDLEISAAPETPVASVEGGEYKGSKKVALTTATEGAEIYYTTDGTTPTEKSTKYTKEISIKKTCTLKAIAVKDGVVSKDVMSVDYTIKIVSGGGGGGGSSYTPPAVTTYTVTFDLNYEGTTGAPAAQTVVGGSTATAPTAPTREGFAFVGWTTDTETNTVFDFTTTISSNVTLYAIWNPGYVVSFDLNCEGATGAPESQNISVGGKATLPDEPSRDGYTFTGWATTPTGETMWNFAHFVTESMTLYAIWAGVADVSLDTPDADVEIYSFDTDVYDILLGSSAEVTFTSEIFANIELSDTDVSIVDETGAILGYMNDDGTNGDETANDGIYTLKQTLNADAVGNTLYHVAVKDDTSETINIGYYRIYTEQEFDTYNSVVEQLDDIMIPFVDENENLLEGKYDEAIEAIKTKLDSLIEDETVLTYAVNGYSIDITLKEGLLFAYVIKEFGKESAGGNNKIITYEPFKDTWGDWSDESTDSADGSAERIVNELNNYTFNDNLDLEAVNLENLKHMGNHKVVIWRGHGGYDTEHGSLLYTGINMTRSLYSQYKEKYSADINSKRIKLTSGSCAITGGFIKTYVSDLDNAIVWLGGCETGKDMIDSANTMHSLAQAFIDKGATAVIGTNKSVYTNYSSYFAIDVFKGLLKKDSNDEYYTLQNAFKFATDNNGSDDGHGAKFLIFPQNDTAALNYRLYEEAMGSISGKVMSADNATDIGDALVRIYQNNDLIKSVRTDSQGNYTVELPAGDYIVKITAGNYKSAKMAVTVAEDTVTYNETFLLVQIGDEIGYANGTITNALNAQAVSDVTVKVRSSWNNQTGSVVYTTTTNDAGYYEIEYIPGLYTIEFSKDEYITGYKNIVVGVLGLFAQNAVISPVMSDVNGEYRFVLSWRNLPNDLDSHLTGPLENTEERFHLYYPLKDTLGADANPYREYATLDWDNTRINQNPDPETVTLHKQIDGVYRYSVHDFSNGGNASSTDMANSNAQVDVYKGSIHIGTYHVPNIPGTIWTVFELSGDVFTPVNRVGNGNAGDINLYSFYEDSREENEILYDENVILSNLETKE